MRLMEDANVYQIAKNCRTSVERIEKFYSAHITNVLDAAAMNVMRPKLRQRKSPTDLYESEVDAEVLEQLQ